jgi:hypothetical protein
MCGLLAALKTVVWSVAKLFLQVMMCFCSGGMFFYGFFLMAFNELNLLFMLFYSQSIFFIE